LRFAMRDSKSVNHVADNAGDGDGERLLAQVFQVYAKKLE
jgi:hypothetical protein